MNCACTDLCGGRGAISVPTAIGDLDRVIDFDSEVANGAFDLRMSEQKLHRSEIPGASVDQYCLRASQRMRTELGWIEPDACDPLLNQTGILPRGQPALGVVTSTSKQELASLATGQSQILVDRHPRLVSEFEPNRPASLLLADGCTIHRIAAGRDVIDTDGDNVATAQLAVDRQVEEGEIPFLPLDLQLRPDRPDVAWPQGRLGTDELAFVPRGAAGRLHGGRRVVFFHGLSPWLRDKPECARLCTNH